MLNFVNAKINLGLNIIRKRADGYHELATLFYPVGLYNGTPENPEPFCDVLEVNMLAPVEEDRLMFSGSKIECPPESNLAVKALRAFREAFATRTNAKDFKVELRLEKHIPDGAGLGGGSADASFVLRTLNSLLGDPFSKEELITVAAGIGADCPFFIENRPVIATGIGELMEPYPLDLSGFWAVIVKPKVYVSTREAFAGITPNELERALAQILALHPSEWEKEGLRNDFEAHIFKMYPILPEIKTRLQKAGADYAAMSGSGSSLFGIFPSRHSAEQAALQFPGISYLIKL